MSTVTTPLSTGASPDSVGTTPPRAAALDVIERTSRLLTLVPLIGRDSLAPERLDLMVKDALIFVGRIDTGALGNGGQHRVELREAMSELRPATTHRS